MNRNNIPTSKYCIKKLFFNDYDDLRGVLRDCRKNIKQTNIDIILASDVLDTSDNAITFFETISFYFNIYKEQQRLKFRKRKQKEFENKQSTPNVQCQFNAFQKKAVNDIKKPITNGGVLPYLLKPSVRSTPSIKINTGPSPSMNTTNNNHNHNHNHNHNQENNTILSSHSDDETTNSRSTMASQKNMQLPNTTHLTNNSENKQAYDYKIPYIQHGSSISAISCVANVEN